MKEYKSFTALNILIDPELMRRLDECSKLMGLSRRQYVIRQLEGCCTDIEYQHEQGTVMGEQA